MEDTNSFYVRSPLEDPQRRELLRESGRLTDVDYWSSRHTRCQSIPEGGNCPRWYKHISHLLPHGPCVNCLEVGVVPGAYLLYLARAHQYSCNGIDFSPEIHEVAAAFQNQGIKAKFIEADFLEWSPAEKYDFVYSCGFIEHFDDYESVIQRHWRLVRTSGLMLLSVPLLTPIQWLARLIFYERSRMRKVLHICNLKIMCLSELERVVREFCPDGTILASAYDGEMTFWFRPDEPGIRRWSRPLFRPLRRLEHIVGSKGICSRWFSPEAFVLARKNDC